MPSDPREWIAASLLPGIGPVTLSRLYRQGIPPDRLLTTPPPPELKLRRDTRDALQSASARRRLLAQADELLSWAESSSIRVLALDQTDYPLLLAQIHDPPPLLWVRGDADLLARPQLAIVGSRHASAGGKRCAYDFAAYLSSAGLVVTSGLALGIDSEAHRGAVEQSAPTVAVMGTSIERIYPRRNQPLADAILQHGGCLVSELLPGSPPLAAHFPRRNRIISGLSVGTLVVEAALKSGSLITAREALEQGREVFAIPGSIANPLSRGCHALIRDGAVLVENARHIIEQLDTLLGALLLPDDRPAFDPALPPPPLDGLLLQIPFDLIEIDQLPHQVGLSFSEVQQGLMQLQLGGWIEPVGSAVRRCC